MIVIMLVSRDSNVSFYNYIPTYAIAKCFPIYIFNSSTQVLKQNYFLFSISNIKCARTTYSDNHIRNYVKVCQCKTSSEVQVERPIK